MNGRLLHIARGIRQWREALATELARQRAGSTQRNAELTPPDMERAEDADFLLLAAMELLTGKDPGYPEADRGVPGNDPSRDDQEGSPHAT